MICRRICCVCRRLSVYQLNWFAPQEAPLAPQGLDALGARATLHSDLTFDESMLHCGVPDHAG